MVNNINFILHKIEEVVSEEKDKQKIGLYNGVAGRLLFYLYLRKYVGRGYNFQINNDINKLIRYLKSVPLSASFGNGFPGIAWVLSHMDKKLCDSPYAFNLENINNYIIESLKIDFYHKNYDPLHGFIAKGNYLLNFIDCTTVEKSIHLIIRKLISISIKEGGTFLWYGDMHKDRFGEEYYDFGIAHGVSGILIFLSKIFDKGILCKELYPILESTVQWIINHQNSVGSFPNFLKKNVSYNNDRSLGRLAWCYGDLCIAILLNKVGRVLRNYKFLKYSHDILIKCTQRDIKQSGIFYDKDTIDVTFCHGSAGIAYIYKLMNEYYNDIQLKSCYNKWLNYTIKYTKLNLTKINMYKNFYKLNKKQEENTRLGLFNGYIGVGLVLMSTVNSFNSDWEEIFYLS